VKEFIEMRLTEWHEKQLTKDWESEFSAERTVQILRLLGYEGNITVKRDHLMLTVGTRTVYLPAGYCEQTLPYTLDKRIQEFFNEPDD
jgi:hypothetical protein